MIQYQNGTKDIFAKSPSETPKKEDEKKVEIEKKEEVVPYVFSKEMYEKGRMDAKKYYKNYKKAGTWSLLAGTVFWYYGASAAAPIVMGSVGPSEENLDYPSQHLFDNESYRNGYMATAKKIKRKKVWIIMELVPELLLQHFC